MVVGARIAALCVVAGLGLALGGGALAQEIGPHGFPISNAPRPEQPIPANCDRACLEHVADEVAAAMVAHDPSHLPLSQDVKYTEGGSPLKLGDGFWATASGLGTYRHYFADPAVGQVVVMRTMQENGNGLLAAIRVRVELNRITEIETVFYKKGSGPAWNDAGIDNLDKVGGPPAKWLETVPPGQRQTRQQLIDTANYYFEGLQRNDGHGYYPFTPTCNRLENGVATTNNTVLQMGDKDFNPGAMGCKEQFSTGYYGVVREIGDRRWLIADPERGIALAFAVFKHSGTVPVVHLTNGRDFPMKFFSKPSSIQIVEAFRIVGDQIDLVEAVGASAPYGMKSGWPGGLSGR
jgi:hypothetical protein